MSGVKVHSRNQVMDCSTFILLLTPCNSISAQVLGLSVSIFLLVCGGWLLTQSRIGKVKETRAYWKVLRGEEAKLWSTITAVGLLLFGGFIFLIAAVHYLTCESLR